MSETTTPALKPEEMRFGTKRPKVPPFARFRGTSAWRKYHRRAREYAKHLAAEKNKATDKA